VECSSRGTRAQGLDNSPAPARHKQQHSAHVHVTDAAPELLVGTSYFRRTAILHLGRQPSRSPSAK
jgi:hypothetical protein